MNIIEKKLGFFRGLKLKENKKSSTVKISFMPLPQRVVIPMQQHTGTECELVVNRGDYVKQGQLIGKATSFISANIHSSISGQVKSILRMVNPVTNEIINAVEIISTENTNSQSSLSENTNENFKDYESSYNIEDYIKDYLNKINTYEANVLLEKIKDAGIVGLGGAAFPTHVKLTVPKGKNIDTVILNGCECEPYITSDHRIMLEHGFEVVIGALIISKIVNPKQIIITVEDNKKDAAESLAKKIKILNKEDKIKIAILPSRYPMGAEKTLIKNILNRRVPQGGLPLDVGVVVQNVSTSKAIFDAVLFNKPLIERVITITGDIEKPYNLVVKVGTLLIDLIDYFGKINNKKYKIIFGGPMTGYAVGNINFPITKGVNCILLREVVARLESNCIRCSRCISICPMNLEPLMYVNFVKNSKYLECSSYYIESCIECGSCAYVCPASIPIVGYIKTGKAALARK